VIKLRSCERRFQVSLSCDGPSYPLDPSTGLLSQHDGVTVIVAPSTNKAPFVWLESPQTQQVNFGEDLMLTANSTDDRKWEPVSVSCNSVLYSASVDMLGARYCSHGASQRPMEAPHPLTPYQQMIRKRRTMEQTVR
jgi:hypothetical protein